MSTPSPQVCPTCPMMLPNRCSFSAHQRMHRNRPPHVCPECGGNFLQANFQTHLREACLHFSRRVGYRCPAPLLSRVPTLPHVLAGLVAPGTSPFAGLSRAPSLLLSRGVRSACLPPRGGGTGPPGAPAWLQQASLGARVSTAPPRSTLLGSTWALGRYVRWGCIEVPWLITAPPCSPQGALAVRWCLGV